MEYGFKVGFMKPQIRLRCLPLLLASPLSLLACIPDWFESSCTSEELATANTFVMIHFEAGHKGRINNDLPIDLPAEFLAMDYGWQEYHFETAKALVKKADHYGFRLTLAFNPQWAEFILLDDSRKEIARQWQNQGHEIAFHHHAYKHPDWNGYSNDPTATRSLLFLGDVDDGLALVKKLALPASLTTVMISGLPGDMPQSCRDTPQDLIFTGGNQHDSFEQFGELRSLHPSKVVKLNGGTVIRVAHRQLTILSKEISIQKSLAAFKAEYNNMESDEIYGIVFHCFEYRQAEAEYNDWFEFVKDSGDQIRTIQEIVADYEYDIPVGQAPIHKPKKQRVPK